MKFSNVKVVKRIEELRRRRFSRWVLLEGMGRVFLEELMRNLKDE